LEHYWNGQILTTLDTAPQWAANMTWNGISPLVRLVEGTYAKHISVPKEEMAEYEGQWQWSEVLPKWDVSIIPA
jgi:hypothetical protein